MRASAEVLRTLCCPAMALLLVFGGPMTPAVAQFGVVEVVLAEDVEEDEEAEEGEAEEEMEELAVGNVQALVGRQQVDQWIFPTGNEQSSRQYLQNQLKMRTDDIQRECPLADAQLQRLELAGRIEVKRLFDRIDEMRRKYAGQKQNNNNNFNQQMWQDVQPLRMELTGSRFGEGSLFDKIVRKTLTAEQLPAYREQQRQRREFRRRAQIELLLASIDKQVPLKTAQRTKLRDAMAKLPAVRSGQYEFYALLYLAAKIPEENYRAILDERQFAALKLRFNQAQGFEQWLKQTGALEPEPNLDAAAHEVSGAHAPSLEP